MANRVVVGPLPGGGSGLRVSRPGYNALDNGLQPKQVAFDSRWGRSSRVVALGSIGGVGTVYYGTTLAAIPLVVLVQTDAQGRYRNYSVFGNYGGSPGTSGHVPMRAYTDRLYVGIGGSWTYCVVRV